LDTFHTDILYLDPKLLFPSTLVLVALSSAVVSVQLFTILGPFVFMNILDVSSVLVYLHVSYITAKASATFCC
jgi:hypothetical protein